MKYFVDSARCMMEMRLLMQIKKRKIKNISEDKNDYSPISFLLN